MHGAERTLEARPAGGLRFVAATERVKRLDVRILPVKVRSMCPGNDSFGPWMPIANVRLE
jgi:hypothetical protein